MSNEMNTEPEPSDENSSCKQDALSTNVTTEMILGTISSSDSESLSMRGHEDVRDAEMEEGKEKATGSEGKENLEMGNEKSDLKSASLTTDGSDNEAMSNCEQQGEKVSDGNETKDEFDSAASTSIALNVSMIVAMTTSCSTAVVSSEEMPDNEISLARPEPETSASAAKREATSPLVDERKFKLSKHDSFDDEEKNVVTIQPKTPKTQTHTQAKQGVMSIDALPQPPKQPLKLRTYRPSWAQSPVQQQQSTVDSFFHTSTLSAILLHPPSNSTSNTTTTMHSASTSIQATTNLHSFPRLNHTRNSINAIIRQFEDAQIQDHPDLSHVSDNPDMLVLVNIDKNSADYLKPIPEIDLDRAGRFLVLNASPRVPWIPESSSNNTNLQGQNEFPAYWQKVMNRVDAFHALEDRFTTFMDITNLIPHTTALENLGNEFPALQRLYFSKKDPEIRSSIVRVVRFASGLLRKLPELFPKGIPLLRKLSATEVDATVPDTSIVDRSITMSQEQCACLMAGAFFGIFGETLHDYNDFNINYLFQDEQPLSAIKLKFIFHYFERLAEGIPQGVVSFRRISYGKEMSPQALEQKLQNAMISNCTLFVDPMATIEDLTGHRQMDFANEYIGGGVLGQHGSAQEEIRFLNCPEMIVSCLLCEKMESQETIQIFGAQRYSTYTGYGRTLQWRTNPNYGKEERDKFGRIKTILIALDAICYSRNVAKQYETPNVMRDLVKCIVGFEEGLPYAPLRRPIATGNWGAGAFRGDPRFKALLQILAASLTGSALTFSSFGNQSFAEKLTELYEALCRRKINGFVLYTILLSYRDMAHNGVNAFDYVNNFSQKISGIQ